MTKQIARVKSARVPADSRGSFDADAFFDDLDAVRIAQKKTWKQVAEAAGVSASTLTRMSQGKRPDVDSLAALVAWSGLSADDYVAGATVERLDAEPLAMISTYLRSDKHLSPDAVKALDAVIKATYERLRGG